MKAISFFVLFLSFCLSSFAKEGLTPEDKRDFKLQKEAVAKQRQASLQQEKETKVLQSMNGTASKIGSKINESTKPTTQEGEARKLDEEMYQSSGEVPTEPSSPTTKYDSKKIRDMINKM